MTQSDIINNNFSKAFECIKCSNAYDTGAVLSEEKLFKQISERKHSTFDPSKFTIVGSPTITDDGVVSGFSNSNYLKLPQPIVIGQNKSWEVKYSSVIPEVVVGNIITNSFTVGRVNTTGSFSVLLYMYNPTTQTYSNVGVHLSNLGANYAGQKYNAVIKYDGVSTYSFILTLENGETRNATTTSQQYYNNINLYIGGDTLDTPIDLKHFSITVDGKEVFSGNKTGIDTVKINDTNVEIPYTLSKTGSKIVDVAYRDRVIDLYEQQGHARYYTIDEDNKNFTLPMGEIYGMIGGSSSTGGSGSGYNLFDLKYSDHILEGNEAKGFALLGSYAYKTAVAGSRYGYPDFYNKCVAEKIAGTETTITVGDYSFTGYKNANGHIFFDIADKDTVDNIYTSTGKAWYYGIDIVNERIFLPRVKNALVGMADIADTSAVVPNPDNPSPSLSNGGYNGTSVAYLNNYSAGGHPYNLLMWPVQHGASNQRASWSIHGNTGLLSDNANVKSALNNDNFYIYMCVGNTEQEGAVTDVIDITTSENDTLPLGWSDYQKGVTPSSAFLASLGQQNSGTFYPTFYNEFSAKIGQAFGAGFVKAHTASDITDYDLVINQDKQTFRLPLKNGKENLVDYTKPTTFAVATNFTAPLNGIIYASSNAYSGNKAWYWTINGGEKHYFGGNSSGNVPVTVKVKKGDVFYITGNSEGENNFYFYPFTGNGTLYYKVSNAVQNLQLLDVAEVTTALANKVDSTNTQWAVNACMPDYSARVDVSSYNSSTNQFTAPVAGWLIGGKGTTCLIYINDYNTADRSSGNTTGGISVTLPMSKGDKYYRSGDINRMVFCPAKGAQ